MSTLEIVEHNIDKDILLEFTRVTRKLGLMRSYTQAAGGNTSYKFSHDLMIIKASGFCLSEMKPNSAYSVVEYQKIINELKAEHPMIELSKFSLAQYPRPSLETSMHCLLGKFVFHLHPLYLYKYLCHESGEKKLNEQAHDFSYPWEWIHFHRPGDSLAQAILQSSLIKKGESVQIYFLQNHGVIISVEKLEVLEFVLSDLEQTFSSDPLLEGERLIEKIQSSINQEIYLKYFESPMLDNYIFYPLTPDDYIYWGFQSLEIDDDTIMVEIEKYKKSFKELPKVLIYRKMIFLMEESLIKLSRLCDVFSAHYHFIKHNRNLPFKKLEISELEFLRDWEAEKIRKEGGLYP